MHIGVCSIMHGKPPAAVGTRRTNCSTASGLLNIQGDEHAIAAAFNGTDFAQLWDEMSLLSFAQGDCTKYQELDAFAECRQHMGQFYRIGGLMTDGASSAASGAMICYQRLIYVIGA